MPFKRQLATLHLMSTAPARGWHVNMKRIAMHGFYWLIEGSLAGCPRPGGWQRPALTDADQLLADDLRWLGSQGVGAILSLTEEPLSSALPADDNLDILHLPVDDLTAPSPAQVEAALAFIDRHIARGHAVAVHCKMGQGRTGTVLAAYLIRSGRSADDAIAELRRRCPGAISSPSQEAALAAYACRRDWLV